jgi:fructose-1,6-bisphosphatase I
MSLQPLTLHDYLFESKIAPDLRYLIDTIARICKQISYKIKHVDLGVTGEYNQFGDAQLALDVFSNDLVKTTLLKSGLVSLLASEEEDKILQAEDNYVGSYVVAYDPLDGSSLIDVNFALGSIFSIYQGDKLIGRKGDEQIAALYVLYGPRTTLVLTVGQGTHEFLLNDVGEFHIVRPALSIAAEGKYFAPGDLKACCVNESYNNLIQYWIKNAYKLRYSGGMVPDINHILMKGKGIFSYPATSENPDGKLRLLFECHPLSFIAEQAGGSSTDGRGNRVLDIINTSLDQKTPIYIGSSNEVTNAEKILNGA